MDKQGEKKQVKKKCEGGVFHRQDWSQFNPLAKRNSFCKTNICEKHPLIGENCIQSLKNMDFAHFHSFYKGNFRQKSLISPLAKGIICGLGSDVYLLGIQNLKKL